MTRLPWRLPPLGAKRACSRISWSTASGSGSPVNSPGRERGPHDFVQFHGCLTSEAGGTIPQSMPRSSHPVRVQGRAKRCTRPPGSAGVSPALAGGRKWTVRRRPTGVPGSAGVSPALAGGRKWTTRRRPTGVPGKPSCNSRDLLSAQRLKHFAEHLQALMGVRMRPHRDMPDSQRLELQKLLRDPRRLAGQGVHVLGTPAARPADTPAP